MKKGLTVPTIRRPANYEEHSMAVQLEGAYENVLDLERNDVAFWTTFFHEASCANALFEPVTTSPLFKTRSSALAIGGLWHQFSEFMPKFLCRTASLISNNLGRSKVIQIAWEELGMGRSNEIHADLFSDCLKIAGVDPSNRSFQTMSLSSLYSKIDKETVNDSYLFGICLGLEIVANENIDTIFHALAHNERISEELAQTPFFKLHRVNEDEHIDHNVRNFLKFCESKSQREEFLKGFFVAIEFWKDFWRDARSCMTLRAVLA